jgi:hypothetical protein
MARAVLTGKVDFFNNNRLLLHFSNITGAQFYKFQIQAACPFPLP